MVKLSTRLKIVYDMLSKCECLADVGCDHGYLSIAVAQGQIADSVIAMDINAGPLEAAKKNIVDAGLNNRISILKSDGLKALKPFDCDAATICGMGGVLITKILQASIDVVKNTKYVIVEPQSEFYLVREFLYTNDFVIDDEAMVCEEHKYYPIIRFHYEAGASKNYELSEAQKHFGPVLLEKRPDIFFEYLEKYEQEINDILIKLEGMLSKSGKSKQLEIRVQELSNELALIKNVMK